MEANIVHLMAHDQLEELLRQHPLFSRLTDDQLNSLKKISRKVKLEEGESLFFQGSALKNLYLVTKGSVKLFRHNKAGQEKIFNIARSGDLIGETSIFHEKHQYQYSSVAVTDSTVIAINSPKFLDIIKDSPDALMVSLGYLSQRVLGLFDEIERLSVLTGCNRVASYLYDQSLESGESFSLGIKKKEIASILGLTPETFSRILKELTTKKIISLNELHITITDDALLKELAYK